MNIPPFSRKNKTPISRSQRRNFQEGSEGSEGPSPTTNQVPGLAPPVLPVSSTASLLAAEQAAKFAESLLRASQATSSGLDTTYQLFPPNFNLNFLKK